MRQRLIFFLLGLCPVFLVDTFRGLDGLQAGTTIANAILWTVTAILAVLFVCAERLFWPLVPKALRGTPILSLAMGVSIFLAASLLRLLPAETERMLTQHFRWELGYLFGSILILFPLSVRLLDRAVKKRPLPQRVGLVLVVFVVLQLSLSAFLETRELLNVRQQSALAKVSTGQLHEAPQRPNVLLLVLDTLRFDTFRQTWQGQQHFPALDAFTKDAAFYTRGYAGCNVTPGGHTTLFTGMYPAETNTLTRGLVQLDDSYLTVAEFLRSYGYRTGAFVSNARVSGRFGYQQGFEVYNDSLVNPVINASSIGERVSTSSLVTLFGSPYSNKLVRSLFLQLSWGASLPTAAVTSEHALQMVAEMDIQPQEPWFLFLNYIDPHTPFVTRKDLADAFGPGYSSERLEGVRRSISKFHIGLKHLKSALRKGEDRSGDLNWLQEVYREQCLELDEGVMQFLDGLREQGLLDDNTLILITSDHGEHLGEHQEFNHGSTLLDEEVRVPFLLLGPGIEPGEISIPVSGADFFSTVCYALGLDGNDYPETSGVPLQIPRPNRVIRFEHGQLRGFLQGNYKMIAHDLRGELVWKEAYDLSADPQELNNLIASGLDWVEDYIANSPIYSFDGAELIVAGDGSLDLSALGYADEVAQ